MDDFSSTYKCSHCYYTTNRLSSIYLHIEEEHPCTKRKTNHPADHHCPVQLPPVWPESDNEEDKNEDSILQNHAGNSQNPTKFSIYIYIAIYIFVLVIACDDDEVTAVGHDTTGGESETGNSSECDVKVKNEAERDSDASRGGNGSLTRTAT